MIRFRQYLTLVQTSIKAVTMDFRGAFLTLENYLDNGG